MAKKKRASRKSAEPKPFRVEPGWLNKSQMAAALGISVQAFGQWDVEPVARNGRQVFYTIRDVLDFVERRKETQLRREYQRFMGTDNEADPRALELAQMRADLLLTQERAEQQRLKNAELRKELAPVEMLTWALSDLASQVTPLLTPIPGEMKRRVPKITNSELHVMREIIANALNLVAEVRLDIDAYEPDGE